MNYRLLILAGGVASRMKKSVADVSTVAGTLQHQAATLTKGMIGVGQAGKPLLDYLIYHARQAGCTEVLLLLHPADTHTQAYYEQQMQENKVGNLSILFARQHLAENRTKPAGTADAVWQALQQHPAWQTGRLVVCNSDNLYSVTAFRLLWQSPQAQALISYNRVALGFAAERIKAFAVIQTDAQGFLKAIIEKPTDLEVAAATRPDGHVGVSMNIFVFAAETILPYLARTPYHPIRNEKEIPTTLNLLLADQPQAVYTIPLAEKVPDLTSKDDIAAMQEYLNTYLPDL